MNPCAPTFVPTGLSDEEFSSEEESSMSSSIEARRSDQDVRSPKARSRSGTLPSINFDPDKYNSMFPTIRTANPVNPHIIRSPGLAKKRVVQKSGEHISKAGHFRPAHPPSDKRLSSAYKDCAEYEVEYEDEDADEDSDEPAVEYLKPTVYTPRKSLEYLKPTVFTPPTSSRNASKRSGSKRGMRSHDAKARPRSPRRAWRPPTPHPEGKPRGSRGGRRAPTPAPQVVQQAGYLAPIVQPPTDYGYYDQRAPYPVMQPIPPYMPPMGQPMMSYSPVPWQMPSTSWQNPVPQLQYVDSSRECMCTFCDPSSLAYNLYCCTKMCKQPPSAPQPYFYTHTQQQLQPQPQVQYPVQPQPRPEFYSSSQISDSQTASHNESVKSLHARKKSTSSSVVAAKGPAAATPLKTQVEMIKDQSRGAPSGSNRSKCPDV
ncbi:hypothetical protein ACHAPQ_001995 [Fusarium lateritium]